MLVYQRVPILVVFMDIRSDSMAIVWQNGHCKVILWWLYDDSVVVMMMMMLMMMILMMIV